MVRASFVCSSVEGMATYSESESVFVSRVKASGLTEADAALLCGEVKNLKQLAFISSYAPGQSDEKPLMEVLERILGRPAELATKACFRAFWHEAYAVSAVEMKQRVEQTEDTSARKLGQPERAERIERQRKKLAFLTIKGFSEPSESLIDKCVACYESNELRYISWESCASREQEVGSDKKKDIRFTLDEATGRLKIDNKSHEDKADTSSEVLVLQALQRRSLAMDQANLIEYREMELWREKLLRARLTDPPAGFCKPSWSQLIAADKQLFNELRDLTRSGVQSSAAGVRPLDTHLTNAMRMHEVLCLLQPLPHPVPSASRDEYIKERRSPYSVPAKGEWKGKVKGSGKGKVQGKASNVPKQLIQWGCSSQAKKGNPYCYGFQLGTCSNPVSNNACVRGLHACAIPKCGEHGHGASTCPKRKE